jgi:MarR family transcriptional regulator, 2-MHQ and catechol-resistance regulon repressor
MIPGRLPHELKKKRPFELVEEEATLSLARTSDKIRVRVERLFRRFGLQSSSQYNVLRILRGEGAPMRVLDIAERTVTEVPGITGLIDRLEAAGFVRRERCTNDRRVIYVSITEAGRRVLADLDQPLGDLNRRLMAGLSRLEVVELIRLLDKLRAALEQDQEPTINTGNRPTKE